MTNRLWDLFESRFPAPDALCIETQGGRRVTYGRLASLSASMAHRLVALGVEPGDRVAAQVEKSVEALVLYLACLRAGAAFLPLNTAYTAAEIAYFLSDASPRLFVCDPRRRAELEGAAHAAGDAKVETMGSEGEGSFLAKLTEEATFEDRPRRPDDLAAILYTSGTTGRSKGAMLTHENLASNALALVKTWRFARSDLLIHALPIYHTHGLFVATNVTLLSGAGMIFQPGFDAEAIMRAIPRASVLMGVPTFYTRLLRRPDLTADHVRGMRLFISGSAPLLAETHREWRARTGHAILERYGMTETNMITSNPYDGERIPGTVGFPLEGVSVRIADPEDGRPLARGEIGMIEVRGPNVFSGYWNMPEKTASEFRPDGFFITGDLGIEDARGYVQIVGRSKDLVITGGFNVYPKEVEDEIDALEGVVESAVFGVPHPDFGEGVAAAVVRKPGHDLDAEALRASLETRLAKFKQPKAVIFVDELPRNTMGKVQKNVLRETWKHVCS